MAKVLFQSLQSIGTWVEANVPIPEGAQELASIRVSGTVYKIVSGGGPGGTTNYNELSNKPSIEGQELKGDKTLAELGAALATDLLNFYTKDQTDNLLSQKADVDAVYLKSETYNKSEVNELIKNVNQFKVEIVDELPTEDIDLHTIYFKPSASAKTKNIYDEFIYVNNGWEQIGSTQADLSNYYTKAQVDEKIPDVSNFVTKEELNTKADAADVYTKAEVDAKIPDVSDFATKSDLDGKADAVDVYTKEEVDEKIPDVSDFATKEELNTKADASTVYAKTETYTKTEVNELVSTIPTFKIEVVDVLPEDMDDHTLYLVPTTTPGGLNVYDEYIHVNGAWEKIGSTEIDFSNYYTKEEVDAKIPEVTDKRDKDDRQAYIRRNQQWTWENNEALPADFLRLANATNAPKPTYYENSKAWGGVVFYNSDGTERYSCSVVHDSTFTGKETSIVFPFTVVGQETEPSFSVKVTRSENTVDDLSIMSVDDLLAYRSDVYGLGAEIKAALLSKANVSDIPTKTSELINDSGFLTQHQSIKTVNGQTLVGTGNVEVSGARIDDDNVSSDTVWSSNKVEHDLNHKMGTEGSQTLTTNGSLQVMTADSTPASDYYATIDPDTVKVYRNQDMCTAGVTVKDGRHALVYGSAGSEYYKEIESLASDVAANPELSGDEDNITSIKIEGVNYKIPVADEIEWTAQEVQDIIDSVVI